MQKLTRQLAIREIITGSDITSQDQLRKELRKRGFAVTQATLSRDLHELGVSRAATSGGSKYILRHESPLRNIRLLSGQEILSIQHNENLVVVLTLPGCANAVGQYLDQQENDQIMATLAGDNTLLVIPASVDGIDELTESLRSLLTG